MMMKYSMIMSITKVIIQTLRKKNYLRKERKQKMKIVSDLVIATE